MNNFSFIMNVAVSLDSFVDALSLQGGLLFFVILLLTRRHFSTPGGAKQATNISERPPPVRVTLRFRNIPNRIDEASFRKALSRPGHDSGIVGISWTPSATSTSHVATVCFAKDAPFLDKIWQKKDQIDCTIDLVSGGDGFDVLVDDHFLDLTPLYWPERWDIECVFCSTSMQTHKWVTCANFTQYRCCDGLEWQANLVMET